MFFSEDLFDTVLLNISSRQDAASVTIVSGYATAAMASRHLEACPRLHINLIVGMTSLSGISYVNHIGFQQLSSGRFSCCYNWGEPIHSKVYVWYNANGFPIASIVGSANYSQQAFLIGYQKETLTICDPMLAHNYVTSILNSRELIPCVDPAVETRIQFFESVARQSISSHVIAGQIPVAQMPYIDLPLIDRNGNVPRHSGLNWGHRDNLRRNLNQAYIPIPAPIARSHFFPPRTVCFNVMTQEGDVMKMAVAQDGDKALHTTESNALMGRYFRQKLQLPDGALVTIDDLERYGRTTVRFKKDDNENYYMEF